MHLHVHTLWVLLGCMIALAVIYAVYLCYSAIADVQSAPKSDMFLCNKHGFLLPEHLITFGEALDVGTGQFDKDGNEIFERKKVEYCSLCWHANMKKAEQMGSK